MNLVLPTRAGLFHLLSGKGKLSNGETSSNPLNGKNGILQPECDIMQKSFFELDKRLEF